MRAIAALKSLMTSRWEENTASTARPPTIPRARRQATSSFVSRQFSHNLSRGRVIAGHATSTCWRLRPARARKISSSVASRDSTTSPPSARTE